MRRIKGKFLIYVLAGVGILAVVNRPLTYLIRKFYGTGRPPELPAPLFQKVIDFLYSSYLLESHIASFCTGCIIGILFIIGWAIMDKDLTRK